MGSHPIATNKLPRYLKYKIYHSRLKRNQKLVLFFALLFRGGQLEPYKIKPVLFLFTLGLLEQQKLYSIETRKYVYLIISGNAPKSSGDEETVTAKA